MLRILIPARGGSKRIKNKNLLKINGQSLLSRAIKVSLQITNEVYVSTDSYDIEKEAILNGAKVHKRPSIYATDTSPTKEAITDFLNSYKDTINMVLVQCTSPFIELGHLKLSIDNLHTFSSSISVYKETPFYWEKEDIGAKPNYDPFNKPRTQDMSPHYKETGAFYAPGQAVINTKIYFEHEPYKEQRIRNSVQKRLDYLLPRHLFFTHAN